MSSDTVDHDHRLTFGLIMESSPTLQCQFPPSKTPIALSIQFLKISQKNQKNSFFFLKFFEKMSSETVVTIIVSHSVLWNHHQHYNGFHLLNVGFSLKFSIFKNKFRNVENDDVDRRDFGVCRCIVL